jgi:Zn ribbon nucleic-acid-binding protein
VNLELAPVWRDYRNRLAALVIGIVGLVLWADGADGFLGDLLTGDAALHALAAAWITGTAGALVWLAAFRCPYCGKCFHWTLWVANPIADHCLHCGFQKWRDPHAARALGRR